MKSVLRTLYRYPEVVVEAAKFHPSSGDTYLFGLAQRFNDHLNQVVGE